MTTPVSDDLEPEFEEIDDSWMPDEDVDPVEEEGEESDDSPQED